MERGEEIPRGLIVARRDAAVTQEAEGLALNVGGDEPCNLANLADAIIAAFGDGKYEIREFPAERKRIDIGDFVNDDRRFRPISGGTRPPR